MGKKVPELIPGYCGECRYFNKTGMLDRFKGHCDFYNKEVTSSWECLAKVSAKEANNNKKNSSQLRNKDNDQEQDFDQKLNGIGGWLVFPAIGIVLGPIIMLLKLLNLESMKSGINWDVVETNIRDVVAFEEFTNIVLIIFLIYVAILFFKKNKKAPKIFISYIVTALIINVIHFIIGLELHGEMKTIYLIISGKSLIISIISAAIWIPYFKESLRVKATFIQ